jgi:hypothetical protein
VIITLAEVTELDTWALVPRLDYGDLRFLWLTDYRDGPQSGILEYHGERCGYELVAQREEATGLHRRFAVVRLSPEQVATEVQWHEHLRERVGAGRDWEWWMEQYRRRPPPDYSACEVIGWFEC